MMKRIVAIFLAIMMALCFASCGEKKNTASMDEVYIAAAQKCIDNNENDKAVEILKQGIEKTKSEKLQQMLDNLTASTTAAETTAATTVAATAATTTVAPTLAPTTTVQVKTTVPTTKKPTQKKTEAPKRTTKSVVLKLIQKDFEPYEYSPNITLYSDESVDFEYNFGEGMETLTGSYLHNEDEGGESYSCVVNTYYGIYQFSVTRYNRNGQNVGGDYHFSSDRNMGFTYDGVLFSKID